MPHPQTLDPRTRGGNCKVILLPGASDAEKYAAVFFPPPSQDAPVLVAFHGNADQLGGGPSYLGNFFQVERGLGLYGVEYPGYGLSQPGSPSELSINAAAERLLRHLVEDLGVQQERIVLLGQSIGCAVAVEMARRGYGARLVLISPFTSLREIAVSAYPFLAPALKLFPWMVLDKFDNADKAAKIMIPTLVVHGQLDEIVPFWMGQRMAGLTPGAQLLAVPNMGHNDVLDRKEILAEIARFAGSPFGGARGKPM